MTEYEALIASDRVSSQTRNVLLERGKLDDVGYTPDCLDQQELHTLRALLARVIPQNAGADTVVIDLAARLDAQLSTGKGDGWRYAALPADTEAYRIGLQLLDSFAHKLSSIPFDRLASDAQDALISSIASGTITSKKLDLRRWFEDVRSDATKLFVAHPQTLASMGYSGIADNEHGFVQLGIGEREAWEPEPR
ncbi:gluconate 2-dehydrogenase subunit 3 family protein [Granulicella arctica]|uniref:gluconate 2-dehydrogenase subunit 3 family protein n=1 Tax=Granulicella arctica TaxID=940613 RepID=UPI0021DF46C3|nr:gluconate 2-dehydrogenase subunit 3 family protein [Granulicella arctica]